MISIRTTLIGILIVAVAGAGCWSERAQIKPPPVSPTLNGACCSVQGLCVVLTSAGCTGQGSGYLYRGDGTVCTPNPCALPTESGACCSDQGICTALSMSDCVAQGYAYQYRGDGTVCTPNPCPPAPPSTDFVATSLVGSFESKEINTVSGAGLKVPLLSVPNTPAGGEGKMTFSIEKDQTIAITPPAGHTKASDTYRFGPDGFVFERPVTVKVPVLGDTTGKSLILYRFNQTTGKPEPYGGTFDRATKSITVQTYKLSPWFVGTAPQANTAWGAIEVTNSSLDQWLNLCVEQYTLKYPDADADFRGEASSSWAPVGEIGVTNHGLWYLPQGTYRICAEMMTAGTVSAPPGPPRHVLVENFRIDSSWSRQSPISSPLTFSGLGPEAVDGNCPCQPVPTPSVGTGDVQVTLTWHSAQPIDLDLWVTEPDGTRCYYGHSTTSTGGSLDIDNKCGNYVDGRPENIFWANAPTGEYKVEVDWYSDCLTGVTSMGYDVRVINAGTVRTFSGTITPQPRTLEITRFTVVAGRPARFSPAREPSDQQRPRPSKG